MQIKYHYVFFKFYEKYYKKKFEIFSTEATECNIFLAYLCSMSIYSKWTAGVIYCYQCLGFSFGSHV